ncbi:MAG: hypothetical protein RL242_2901 [Pseudomonadota bacterium]
MSRIIIIGGSGHVGSYLVPTLVTMGHEVVNVSRGISAPYRAHSAWEQVESVTLDRTAEEAKGEFGTKIAALQPDIVVDMISFDLPSMQQLVEALHGKIDHYLFCSTIWVYGSFTAIPSTEADLPNPIEPYGRNKAEMEAWLGEQARRRGFPATSFRPGHIVGEGWLPINPLGNLNPEVFSLRPEEIRAFQIQDRLSNNTRVRVERGGQSWEFVSPVQTSANPEAVLAFLEQWSFLQTESFMDATTGLQSQAQESLRFTLEAFGKREILLLTAPVNPGDPYIGQREGFATAFALDANLVNSLRAVQGDLRERRLLRPHSQEWSSIEIQFGELNVSLQQLENGAWQVLHTDAQGDLRSYPADLAAIEQLRQLMLTMEAQGFVTDAPSAADLERFGLNDPQRLILIRKDNQQAVTLAIGGMPPDQDRALLYAQLDSNASVFLVRPDLLAAFSLDPFHYRDRTLFTLPADLTIDTISLTDRRQGNLVDLDARPDLQAALLNLLQQARVQRLWKYPFADPLPLDDGRSIDWPLELSITYTAGLESAEQRSKSVFLSSRIGGRTLLLGDPQSGLVGSLPEALAFLIDEVLVEFPAPPPPMSLPPEP